MPGWGGEGKWVRGGRLVSGRVESFTGREVELWGGWNRSINSNPLATRQKRPGSRPSRRAMTLAWGQDQIEEAGTHGGPGGIEVHRGDPDRMAVDRELQV